MILYNISCNTKEDREKKFKENYSIAGKDVNSIGKLDKFTKNSSKEVELITNKDLKDHTLFANALNVNK